MAFTLGVGGVLLAGTQYVKKEKTLSMYFYHVLNIILYHFWIISNI